MTDPIFRRKWQLVLLASSVSLTACGGGGGDSSTSGGLTQSITFDYPGGATLAAGPVTLHATATSGLPVSFRSQTPDSCTVSGDQLTVLSAKECLVIASQPGGTSSDGKKWAAADDAGQLFNVLKHAQIVSFTPPDYVLSATTSSVTLSATADSGLPVTFSSTTPDVCAISGSTLQIKARGSCAVTATQAGDATYAPQSTQRFVAVDPLILADGFTSLAATDSGVGSSDAMTTRQGGAVAANPWSSLLGGWEGCPTVHDLGDSMPTDKRYESNANWCYRTVSSDGSTLTSALHLPESKVSGWYTGFNRINIFAPGTKAFNGSGDTTTGVRVTTEKSLVFTLGVNAGLYTNGKPVVVFLDLGKRNNGCNVELSAQIWPKAAGSVSYSIALGDFAVTNNCGLAGVNQTSLDNVRKVPTQWPTAATPDAAQKYQAALDTFKDARTSATALLQSSDIARVRFWMYDFNDKAPTIGADGSKRFDTDLSIKGAITLQ